MITLFDIGFGKLSINMAEKRGVAVFGGFDQRPLPVTEFKYLYGKPSLTERRQRLVRFKVVQEIPELHASPFTATIEAELVTDPISIG